MITSCNHQEKQVIENLLRGELLKRALPYLEASLLGRLYSEMQGAHNNKALHKALEQECSGLETLIEEIRGTTGKSLFARRPVVYQPEESG